MARSLFASLALFTAFVFLVFPSVVRAAQGGSSGAQPISESEANAWTEYAFPLPKQIIFTGKVSVPLGQVGVTSFYASERLVKQGIIELWDCFCPDDSPTQITSPGSFNINLTLGGPKAESLKKLNNSEQAYRILPQAPENGLELVALTPQGLYYACKTLKQLLKVNLSEKSAEIPILTVLDWPDITDRGLWGTYSFEHCRWLSDMKMNHLEQLVHNDFDEDGNRTSTLSGPKKAMLTDGAAYGIRPVPIIVHLEIIGRNVLFDRFPQYKGVGGKDGAICYSQPGLDDILADWLVSCGRMPEVTEVDVWMTENLHPDGGCACEKCSKENRDLLEIRTILCAWKKAKKTVPHLGLRILTSEETSDSNELVFAQLPRDVKIWYYHSLLTYFTSEVPIVPDYLQAVADEGRYAGVCLNLCGEVSLCGPFTGAEFIRYRMNEFVDKGISGLLGFANPLLTHNAFNLEAAAEWSWNSEGRTTREFAYSYAVRKGMEYPETFAEWSETIGPVGWDIYGSQWPAGEKKKCLERTAQQLSKNTLPELGYVLWDCYPKPWGDIKSVQHLEDDVRNAERAVKLAERMGDEALLYESLIIQGYINSLRALYGLRAVVTEDGVVEENIDKAKRDFAEYARGLDQARRYLPMWEARMPKHASGADLTTPAVELIGQMIDEMNEVARNTLRTHD